MAVPDGLAADGGPELVEGSRGDGCGFGPSGLKSSSFAAGLVEPGADVALPVLAEVHVREDIVMLDHIPITKLLYLIN